MAAPSTRIVDHIVYLTPVGTLEQASQAFRDLGFTVIPGGEHADGLTANALVILPDGVYLELIAFLHPASDYPADHARTRHQWANKPPGFIAFAFLGAPDASPSISSAINARLEEVGSGVRYKEGVKGGRTRTDGERLEWEICTPGKWAERVDGMGRPFYCGDITPRSLRVPDDPAHRAHANKAQGIAHLRVLTSREAFATHSKDFEAILDGPPNVVVSETEHVWELDALLKSGSSGARRLILPAAESEGEQNFITENGLALFEVGIRVGEGGGSGKGTTYGRITWVV